MHSRIIQISTTKVDEMVYLEDWQVPEWFTNEVADYVIESDREEDIQWLREIFATYDQLTINEYGVITIGNVEGLLEEHFRDRFEEFKEIADVQTFKDFAMGVDIYNIERLIDDERGLYISNFETGDLITMDRFIRSLALGYYKDRVFHIGSTLDYHY